MLIVMVPAYIFHDLGMSVVKLKHRIYGIRQLVLVIDVPDTDSIIITT